MRTSFTIQRRVHFVTGGHGQKHLRQGAKSKSVCVNERVPRIARLMALAIHFDELIREGKVRDYAELARLGQVSRARVTQIMGLLNLSPDIQESLLLGGRTILTTIRQLGRILSHVDWNVQRRELVCDGSKA